MTRHQDSDNVLSLTHSRQENARLAAELCVFAAEAGRDVLGLSRTLRDVKWSEPPCLGSGS